MRELGEHGIASSDILIQQHREKVMSTHEVIVNKRLNVLKYLLNMEPSSSSSTAHQHHGHSGNAKSPQGKSPQEKGIIY